MSNPGSRRSGSSIKIRLTGKSQAEMKQKLSVCFSGAQRSTESTAAGRRCCWQTRRDTRKCLRALVSKHPESVRQSRASLVAPALAGSGGQATSCPLGSGAPAPKSQLLFSHKSLKNLKLGFSSAQRLVSAPAKSSRAPFFLLPRPLTASASTPPTSRGGASDHRPNPPLDLKAAGPVHETTAEVEFQLVAINRAVGLDTLAWINRADRSARCCIGSWTGTSVRVLQLAPGPVAPAWVQFLPLCWFPLVGGAQTVGTPSFLALGPSWNNGFYCS
ncbi:unnamed protein product [Tetraodon nigroviridis]|uniref:(spotted green pufferfish) hypothetical protein n=1 Tax=Tetraodon nigroviridis TaxID=99883 RepID=Q4RZ63_TETNG|nr:unnamed protein product [Tetraodon nigroviridis]